MTHGLGNDVLIRHALVGGEDAVKQHTLQERHLLCVDFPANRACLEVGSHFVQATSYKLDSKFNTIHEAPSIVYLPVP